MQKLTMYNSDNDAIGTFIVSDKVPYATLVNAAHSHAAAKGYALAKINVESAVATRKISLIGMLWLLITMVVVCAVVFVVLVPTLSGKALLTTAIVGSIFIAVCANQTALKLFTTKYA